MLANIVFGLFSLLGLFMMFIILLQRGRGGGLAGAFGGAGGQSAFGTRAGDVFTKITVVVAILWVAMACASIFAFRAEEMNRFTNENAPGDQPAFKSADDKEASEDPFSTNFGAGDSTPKDNNKTDDGKIEKKPTDDTKKEGNIKTGDEKTDSPQKGTKGQPTKKKESGPSLTPPSKKNPEKPAKAKKK